MREPSDTPTRNGGWLHVLRFDQAPAPRPVVSPRPAIQAASLASTEVITAVYTSLLREHLVLSEEHRHDLRVRGLSDLAIERNDYRSTPTQGYAHNVARALAREHDLRGVPGFFMQGREWRLNFGEWSYGVNIPVRDTSHRIRGLMIRRDGVSGNGKYVWLSSKDKPSGASPTSPPHFARVEIARSTGEILITEGALKSDVIAELSGQAVCGIAGVTNFKDTFGADIRRALPEVTRAVVAFDVDFRTKQAVNHGLHRLKDNLRRAGLTVTIRTWQASLGKGLDNALVALRGATL